jgi:uncharacterized coiled-coil DUF342 family protein
MDYCQMGSRGVAPGGLWGSGGIPNPPGAFWFFLARQKERKDLGKFLISPLFEKGARALNYNLGEDMNFNTVGSVSSQIKNWTQRQKWEYRKLNGFQKVEENPFIAKMKEDLEAQDKTQRTERIRHKLLLGKKLSGEDKRWLRENAPDLYEKAEKVEQERDAYEAALRRCRTKADVERLERHMTLSAASTGKGDPEFAAMRIAACQDEYRKYKGTTDYSRLPEGKKREPELWI